MGARYYDPTMGCFLTRDTYLNQKPYAYCDGDPVNFSDPSGHIVTDQTLSHMNIEINMSNIVENVATVDQGPVQKVGQAAKRAAANAAYYLTSRDFLNGAGNVLIGAGSLGISLGLGAALCPFGWMPLPVRFVGAGAALVGAGEAYAGNRLINAANRANH